MGIDLVTGIRVSVRAPVTPRWSVSAPTAPRVTVVPVRGPQGPEGPPGVDTAEALATHVADPTPHPAYDDIPDLTLLFENGLI